ncbi:hypothetical protein BGZ97_007415 [Linnemannia gamsii]|uniref:Uncharacterized protein n=1 Tax=Linnemannia gamsii TaxID=64522 RepID=A0A9P6RNA5_9FUNG|nr:hypothetical protein BGZ97_007415 [Linnemannia gamsii]
MDVFQAAWPFNDTKTPTTPTYLSSRPDMPRPSLYSQLARPKAEQEFLQALVAPFDPDSAPGDGLSPQDPFQVIYRHLHEKHYLDRLIHAFYHRPTLSQQLSRSAVDFGRIAFHNKLRVIYPRPSEIGQAIDQVRALSTQDPVPLLVHLLISPELRFRLCMIAHLIEVAFDIGNGTWNGESPRHLSREDTNYALEKLRDLFQELFQKPDEQASLRRFLTILQEWISTDEVEEQPAQSEENHDQGDESVAREFKLDVPPIVREIFPSWSPILREMQNIKISAKDDAKVHREISELFRFLFLSLKERKLAFAIDWVDEARVHLGPLQKTLSSRKYVGPAQRLIREVVCMTDQLWEGGGATDTSLAAEKCLTILIQKSLQGSTGLPDSGVGIGSNIGWDVMRDFEILIQAASRNIAPIPLPSIVWKRRNSEVIMDAAVLEFPHLMPSNVHLNTTTVYDRQTNRSCRLWHLKISGLEVETKRVAYSYTGKSFLGGKMMDEGELDVVIPPNSLDIDVTFILTPPVVRRGTITALRASIDTIGRRHPIASAARENLFTTSLESQESQLIRRRSNSRNRFGGGLGAMVSSPRAVRFSDTAALASGDGRAAARTGVQIRQQVQETVTDDFWSATSEIVSRFLYPNRPYTPPTSRRQQQRLNVPRTDSSSAGRLAVQDRMTLGRPRRRQSFGNGTIGVISPAEPVGMAHRKFVELKECRINLRRLNVDVLETQHPILQMVSHPIMVRKLRKTIERTLHEMLEEMVNTVNTGVEQIMELTREPSQENAEEVPERPRQWESAAMPQRSYEPSWKIPSSGTVTAVPLYSRS